MTFLLRPELASQIVQMLTDGTINKQTSNLLVDYYEAKRRIELDQGTIKELEADVKVLCEFHEII